MSWLFSRALVEEYSRATCSGGEPSAPLSVMPTRHKFWRNDKTMESCRLSQFGLTCAVLTEDHGAALLTWFLADSRVRTYQLPGMASGSPVRDQGYGVKWQELSVRYDLDSSSWRTHQCLWDEVLPWSSVILPKWGIACGGVLWEPPTSGPHTSVTESGSLPASERKWPTPVASMSKGSSPGSLIRKSGQDRSGDRLDHAVMASDGGQLNPEWVEWLMGWPIGWTELKPLGMDRFREWEQQHSTC
jgi:hypothetical protein